MLIANNFSGEMANDLDNLFARVGIRPYAILYSNTAANAPSNQYGLVLGTYVYAEANALQIAISLVSTTIYVRNKTNNVWGSWRSI